MPLQILPEARTQLAAQARAEARAAAASRATMGLDQLRLAPEPDIAVKFPEAPRLDEPGSKRALRVSPKAATRC